MIKKLAFVFITLITPNSNAQNLDSYNVDRLEFNKKGMLVLGSWAAANIAISPILANSSTGSERYFHQMNGYWNGVNLVIAGVGCFSALKTDPNGLTMSQTLKEQQKLEKTLIFNAGLDLAYIAGGFYLQERSKTTNHSTDQLKGFGQSLVLQGGFLFVFDLIFYAIHKHHGNKLLKLVDNLAIHPYGLQFKF